MFFIRRPRKSKVAKRATRARVRPRVEALEERCTPSVSYFFADDAIHGNELWKSDGTAAGTVIVKDIYPGPSSSQPDSGDTAVFNRSLYFKANDGVNGIE